MSWAPIWNWYNASPDIGIISMQMWQCSSSAEDYEEIFINVHMEVLFLDLNKDVTLNTELLNVLHGQWYSFTTHSLII